MYIDKHYIESVLAKGQTSFTKAEMDLAEAELANTGAFISSVTRDCIAVGLTKRETGGQRHLFSAYAAGFWLAPLSTWDQGLTFCVDGLSLPAWLLYAIGTPHEDEARGLSVDWSTGYFLDDDHFTLTGLDDELQALRSKLVNFGLIETFKKSIHCTSRALAAMNAGTVSQSSRILAIIDRYERIMTDPALAVEIAAVDRFERSGSCLPGKQGTPVTTDEWPLTR